MKKNSINKIVSFALVTTLSLSNIQNIYAYSKNETVYSKLDSNGTRYESVVSVSLNNYEKNKTIKDMSNLLNIQNVSSDKTFDQNGNTVIWNADGENIYYKGETKNELPIDTKIKYELNGKEIAAKDLAGKTGKLKITVEYINKDKHEEVVNGKTTIMYTPFVVLGGTIFKNDIVRNVEVSTGKVIDDGSKTVVLGMALPGMQESLGIEKDSIEIPEKIEITMDVTNYEQNNIVSFVTPKILEDTDIEKIDKLDEVYNNLDVLKSSSSKLEDGANTLKTGTQTFSEKTKEFSSAMNTASDGIATAKDSYTQIDDGINRLYNGSPALSSGTNQIYGGIKTSRQGLILISNGIQTILDSIVAPLDEGIDGVISGIDKIYNMADQGSQQGITKTQELDQVNIGNSQAISGTQAVIDILTVQLATETDENRIAELNTQIATLQGTIKALETDSYVVSQTKESIYTLQAGLTQLKEGVLKIKGGIGALNDNILLLKQNVDGMYAQTEELENGAKTLSDSTVTIQNGLTSLFNGSKMIRDGLNSLNDGANQLNVASNSISEAAQTINEGTITLADGIHTFNVEGINKIYTFINNNVKNVTDRVEVLKKLSDNYNSFTQDESIENQDKQDIKFIMITDAIKLKK